MSDERLLQPGRILKAEEALDLPVWQIQPFAGGIETAREEQRIEAAKIAAKREAELAAKAAADAAAAAKAATMVPVMTPEERERVRREAFDEGYAAGYDQGITAAIAEVQRLEAVARNAGTAFTEFEEKLAPQLLALATAIARQIVRREIAIDKQVVLPVMREAFEQLTGSETGKQLFLNPADVELVRAHLSEDAGTAPWRIVEDARIESGGCRISTRESEIDATVETRWRRTVAALGDPLLWRDAEAGDQDAAAAHASNDFGSVASMALSSMPAAAPAAREGSATQAADSIAIKTGPALGDTADQS
ncbi:hypothetical protein FXN63_16450 [Pigmentiphaga aceris]|uniref:Flagellar assembly protein FliH n=1 Tax=Pigmentiphaga aceris TaxID=1940612 RepID=A0A5C0B3Z8_9BURK|nr:flagellar assembly protein FliH [Pigmentiphaga aceris]QEI07257.1 hypothetical protein FXN63_16450 [Pigmentiphaga aceris]